jgi:hypothetical protein
MKTAASVLRATLPSAPTVLDVPQLLTVGVLTLIHYTQSPMLVCRCFLSDDSLNLLTEFLLCFGGKAACKVGNAQKPSTGLLQDRCERVQGPAQHHGHVATILTSRTHRTLQDILRRQLVRQSPWPKPAVPLTVVALHAQASLPLLRCG